MRSPTVRHLPRIARHALPALALLLIGCVPRTTPTPAPAPPPPVARTVAPAPPVAPPALTAAIASLGAHFDGEVGIAVRDVREGWEADFDADALLPQQSVSKMWVALTVMDAIDRGTMHLTDAVVVRTSDLTLFHSPIRDLVGADGYRTTVYDLLRRELTQSDNTANDVLLWRAGGPPAVRAFLARKGLDGIGFGPGERLLQSGTAGLQWKQDYASGDAFFVARAKLPMPAREAALARYLAAPPDGASAGGVARALAKLDRGELVSRASTTLVESLMHEAKTGPLRVHSGVAPGWSYGHKTGTGQELGSLATGYNDVGILTAPDGHAYTIAVMIAHTRRPIPVRQQLMGNVARAVIATSH